MASTYEHIEIDGIPAVEVPGIIAMSAHILRMHADFLLIAAEELTQRHADSLLIAAEEAEARRERTRDTDPAPAPRSPHWSDPEVDR